MSDSPNSCHYVSGYIGCDAGDVRVGSAVGSQHGDIEAGAESSRYLHDVCAVQFRVGTEGV